MTLSDLAAFGSFIGGVSVVVSFAFLAVQVRQNTRNQRASIGIERAALSQNIGQVVLGGDMSDIWVRGSAGDGSLTSLEIQRYVAHALMTFWLYEEHFYQRRDGMLDDTRWETNERRLRVMLGAPGYRAAWRASSEFFATDFARSVEKIMRETTADADPDAVANGWKILAADECAKAVATVGA